MPPAPERRIPCTMTEGPPSMSKAFALGIDRGPRGAFGARGNDKKKGGPISRVPYPFRGRHHPSRPPVARRIPRGLPADLVEALRASTLKLPLRATSRLGPSELRRRASRPPLLGLARSEACRAASVAGGAVGSYPAISPLPGLAFRPADGAGRFRAPRVSEGRALAGRYLSVALSVAPAGTRSSRSGPSSWRPGVTRRCALMSPDFPPRRRPRRPRRAILGPEARRWRGPPSIT